VKFCKGCAKAEKKDRTNQNGLKRTLKTYAGRGRKVLPSHELNTHREKSIHDEKVCQHIRRTRKSEKRSPKKKQNTKTGGRGGGVRRRELIEKKAYIHPRGERANGKRVRNGGVPAGRPREKREVGVSPPESVVRDTGGAEEKNENPKRRKRGGTTNKTAMRREKRHVQTRKKRMRTPPRS